MCEKYLFANWVTHIIVLQLKNLLTFMVPLESTSTAKLVRCLVTHVMVVEFVLLSSKNTPSLDHPPVLFLQIITYYWRLYVYSRRVFKQRNHPLKICIAYS